MKSSLLEMKIKQISELKRNGIYVLKMTKIMDERTGAWMNQYLNGIHRMTGCVFIVLGPDAEVLNSPAENQIKIITDIVEEVMVKHGLVNSKSKSGIILVEN